MHFYTIIYTGLRKGVYINISCIYNICNNIHRKEEYILTIRICSNDNQLLTTSLNLGDNEVYVKRNKLRIALENKSQKLLINRSSTISREFHQIDGPILATQSSEQHGLLYVEFSIHNPLANPYQALILAHLNLVIIQQQDDMSNNNSNTLT